MSSLLKKLKGKRRASKQEQGQSSTANKRYDLEVTLGCTNTAGPDGRHHAFCESTKEGFSIQTAHIYDDVLQNNRQGWGKAIVDHTYRIIDGSLHVELRTDVCKIPKAAQDHLNWFMLNGNAVEVERNIWSKELSCLMEKPNGVEKVTATLVDMDGAAIHRKGAAQGVNTHFETMKSPGNAS